MNPVTIVIIVAVVVVGWFILVYNGFVRRKNRVDEAWSDIDVQLKRRHNLIPNVVETVKGYVRHEKSVLEEVTKARTKAMSAESAGEVKDVGRAENMLAGALKTLFAVAENYPDLKANANFLDLQRELADTENKIQAARRFYNGNVRDLNTRVESFPYNVVAGIFRFGRRDFFGLEEESAREPTEVSF